MEGEFKCCALESEVDERDWIYEAKMYGVANKLPLTLDLTNMLPKVRSQGARGTCVAFASCVMKEWQERKDCNFKGYMSPDSLYYFRANKPSEGMTCRDVLKILTNRGTCQESDFIYNPFTEPSHLPDNYDSVSKFPIQGYARITSIEGLKTALNTEGPCLITFPVYSQIRGDFWNPSGPDDKSMGGHAVAVVGYNSTGFKIRNSWGELWNMGGYCTYPYEQFQSDNHPHNECWSTVDLRGSQKPEPNCHCCLLF